MYRETQDEFGEWFDINVEMEADSILTTKTAYASYKKHFDSKRPNEIKTEYSFLQALGKELSKNGIKKERRLMKEGKRKTTCYVGLKVINQGQDGHADPQF